MGCTCCRQLHPGGASMRTIIAMAILLMLMFGLPLGSDQEKSKRTDAELKAIAKVGQLGGLAMELAQNDDHLEVSYQQRDQRLTDECLAVLKDLPGLVHLNLRGQEGTDANSVHLQPLTSVTRLHLENTKITDKGLENLRGLVNLEYLNLYGTPITDAGLVQLEGMKKLRSLYLWQTKVTDAGVARLKKALPQVEIVRGFELPKEEKKAEVKKDAPKSKDAAKPKDEKKPAAKKD